jgi:hypothetical protein
MSLPLPLSLRVGTLRRRITVHALRITVMRSIRRDRMLMVRYNMQYTMYRLVYTGIYCGQTGIYQYILSIYSDILLSLV